MSFRRTTEEGEIGEEEGEISCPPDASVPPTDPRLLSNNNTNAPSVPPPPNVLRPPFRRNSSITSNNPVFPGRSRGGRFPGCGQRGVRSSGRGGRGVPRHNSWSAGVGGEQQSTSRWGPSNLSANEQPRRESFQAPPPSQSSPLQRNPSFVGSSAPPPTRKPSFSRGESAGSMGPLQRNFPQTTPTFPRNESLGARGNADNSSPGFGRNESFGGARNNEPPFRGNNEGFQNASPGFSRNESFVPKNELPFRGDAGFQTNAPSFSRNDSFGGSASAQPSRMEPPFRGNNTSNEGFAPSPSFVRSESFGARNNEQQPSYRGLGSSGPNEGFSNRDSFGLLEQNQYPEGGERDAFGRQPQQPLRQEQHGPPPILPDAGHGMSRPLPTERRTSQTGGPPPPPVGRPGIPPPPPSLPPPPPAPPASFPPPPAHQQRLTSSYSSLAEQPPPVPTIPQSSSYGGAPEKPSIPHRASTIGGGVSDMHPPIRSPQKSRKVFDVTSSPQLSRQTSAPPRFGEGGDSSRASAPPPPLTSSQLLAQTPRDPPAVARPTLQASPPETPEKKRPLAPNLSAGPAESPPTKKSSEALLTCSSLGDSRVVARAEKVITQMNELVSIPSIAGESVLPSKQLIMKAVAGLDLNIKKGQSEVKKIQTELEAMVEAEEKEARRIEKERLQVEQTRKDAESKKLELERKAKEEKRFEEHRKKVQVEINERRRILEEEQKRAQDALEGHIQQVQNEERMVRTREIQGQIELAAQAFENDIARAQNSLENATKAAAAAEQKMSRVVADYKHAKENEASLPVVARGEKRESPEMRAMIAKIQEDNKRRAQQAHYDSLWLIPEFPEAGTGEHSNEKSNEQWANAARKVTGLSNALYLEPSEAPYFEANNQSHALIEPLMTEAIREKKRRLHSEWERLAEEYVVRKDIYDKTHTIPHKEKHSTPTSHPSIFGSKPSPGGASSSRSRENTSVSGGRSTSNPYRRARRGNSGNSGDVVRSEYEQEQIIAELTAKEAMEKRIKHGGSKLPRQICQLEKELNGQYIQTFESRYVANPLEESNEQKRTNIWTDMEKCIFLDRFLQHPKDFRKIASFLRNKSTKDCVAFYYDSKQSVPYKKALKEFVMRRKRRGEYHVWDATIQASLSVGAVVTEGPSEAKPLIFRLPESDKTYYTRAFHPLTRELLDKVDVNPADVDEAMLSPTKKRKYASVPLFTLDPSQRKMLRSSKTDKSADDSDDDDTEAKEKTTPARKAPQKWTLAEKKAFHETMEMHGKNWAKLSSAVGTKSLAQIKNYYYDHHKKNRNNGGEDSMRTSAPESTDGDSDAVERSEMYFAATGGAAQFRSGGMMTAVEARVTEQQRAALHSQSLQSAADIWARAQIQHQQEQHLQQHEQQLQQQLSSQEAHRLLHSHQHQQVISNISSMFPWVTAAQVAQAQVQVQAAAIQQQQSQQQQQQESNEVEWQNPTQMQNLLAMRQAGHHGYSMDPSSQMRSIALAGLAAMNQQSLAANGPSMQMDNSGGLSSVYHSNEGNNEAMGQTVAAPSNAAMALGMLAAQQAAHSENTYNNSHENQGSDQNDFSGHTHSR